jgi:microcystin-dependent protein
MNNANFTNTGQLSFTQDVLDFLQSAYSSAIAGICAAIGSNVILAGCTVNNGTRSAGIILLNGEVLPFGGGNDLANFDVQDVVGQRAYYDGSNKDFSHTRTAVMTTAATATSVPAAQFVRIKNLAAFANLPTVWSDDPNATPAAGTLATLQALKAAIAAISIPGGIPSGVITMWSGAVANIPAGWALCNGQNGTPNLTDKFIVGAGNTYAVSATGGEAAHTLSAAEMPLHDHVMHGKGVITGRTGSHYMSLATNNYSGGGSDMLGQSASPDTNLRTGDTGSGAAHNNLPPYYALAYIMKL